VGAEAADGLAGERREYAAAHGPTDEVEVSAYVRELLPVALEHRGAHVQRCADGERAVIRHGPALHRRAGLEHRDIDPGEAGSKSHKPPLGRVARGTGDRGLRINCIALYAQVAG